MDSGSVAMTARLDISPQELGERLKLARETAGITQADAASEIEVARTTLVAMEKGERRVRIQELTKLASFHGTAVNALLRPEAVPVDLVPRFRRLRETANPTVRKGISL